MRTKDLPTNNDLDTKISEIAGIPIPASLRKTGTNKKQKLDLRDWLDKIIKDTIQWARMHKDGEA